MSGMMAGIIARALRGYREGQDDHAQRERAEAEAAARRQAQALARMAAIAGLRKSGVVFEGPEADAARSAGLRSELGTDPVAGAAGMAASAAGAAPAVGAGMGGVGLASLLAPHVFAPREQQQPPAPAQSVGGVPTVAAPGSPAAAPMGQPRPASPPFQQHGEQPGMPPLGLRERLEALLRPERQPLGEIEIGGQRMRAMYDPEAGRDVATEAEWPAFLELQRRDPERFARFIPGVKYTGILEGVDTAGSRIEPRANEAFYNQLPPEVRRRVGAYNPRVDYGKVLQEYIDGVVEQQTFPLGGKTFPNTPEGTAEAVRYYRQLHPIRGGGGGGGGAEGALGGMTPTQQRSQARRQIEAAIYNYLSRPGTNRLTTRDIREFVARYPGGMTFDEALAYANAVGPRIRATQRAEHRSTRRTDAEILGDLIPGGLPTTPDR
jgi:hypothetical protein